MKFFYHYTTLEIQQVASGPTFRLLRLSTKGNFPLTNDLHKSISYGVSRQNRINLKGDPQLFRAEWENEFFHADAFGRKFPFAMGVVWLE